MTQTPPEPIYNGTFLEAKKLLDYAAQAALSSDVTLPTRQYVTVGQAVYDCPQVVSTMLAVTTGLPGASAPGGAFVAACPVPWSIVVELAIVRDCAPTAADDGTPPSTQQLQTAADVQAKDTHILQEVASSRAAEQFGNVSCTISYPPYQGGFLATVARFTVAVSL